MSKQNSNFDVFLSHSASDTAWAAIVARRLQDAGLNVFTGTVVGTGENWADSLWEALTESAAVIALVNGPRVTSSWLAFEVGAAMAWHKPVYVVYQGERPSELPKYVEGFGTFDNSELDQVIKRVVEGSQPLSDAQRTRLGEVYATIGVPTDQLMLQPAKIERLAKAFNRTAKTKLSSEQLLREILRLRKQGRLPTLRHHRVGLTRTSRLKTSA